MLDLLLGKSSVLDTMNLEHKSNDSIIKEDTSVPLRDY